MVLPLIPPSHLSRRLRASLDYRAEARRWGKRSTRQLHSLGVGVAGTVFVDVFDTVLTRRVLGPEPAVDLVARELGPIYGAARAEASHETSAEIFAAVAASMGSGEAVGDLVAAEEAAEFELCVPIPGAARWLDGLRRAGKQVVFVSDMHLSAAVIGQLLRRHGLLKDADELVVSSEWGFTKRSGLLLPAVVKKFGLTPDEVVHVGNDVITDGLMPRRAGLGVMPVPIANQTRFETIAAAHRDRTGGFSAVVGGAARQARLAESQRAKVSADLDLIDIAAGVGGTVGVSFLVWMFDRARRLGLEKLYFIARDGEILMRMAEALPASYRQGIELRYLHANRRSVALAQAWLVGVGEWLDRGTWSATARVLDGYHRVPFHNLCERIGLSPLTLSEMAPELGGLSPEQPLPEERRDAFVAALGDPIVIAAVAEVAKERAELVAAYFTQEGLAEGAAGLVDVGWTGQLAESICQVARPDRPESLVSFHIGSMPTHPEPRVAVEAFLPDAASVDGLVVCVETFTASGAAPAIGFLRSESGVVEPCFADQAAPGRPARSCVRDVMIETARRMPDRHQLQRWCDGPPRMGETAQAILQALWEEPTRAEAEALTPLLYESDDAGRVVIGLTEPLRLGPQGGPRVWGPGSVAVSSRLIRLVAFARRELRKRA